MAERAFAGLKERSNALQDFRKGYRGESLVRSPRDAAAVGSDAVRIEARASFDRLVNSVDERLQKFSHLLDEGTPQGASETQEEAAALTRMLSGCFDCDDALYVLEYLVLHFRLQETHPLALLECALPSHDSFRFPRVASLIDAHKTPMKGLASFCGTSGACPPRRTVALAVARSSAAIRFVLECLHRCATGSSGSDSCGTFFACVAAEALAQSSSGGEAAVLSFISSSLQQEQLHRMHTTPSLVHAALLLCSQLVSTRRLSQSVSTALANTLLQCAVVYIRNGNRKLQLQFTTAAAHVCRAQGVQHVDLTSDQQQGNIQNDATGSPVMSIENTLQHFVYLIEQGVSKPHTPAASRELAEALARHTLQCPAGVSEDARAYICSLLVSRCGARSFNVVQSAMSGINASTNESLLSHVISNCFQYDSAGIEAALAQAGRSEQLANLPGAWAAGKPVSAAIKSESMEERLAAAKASASAATRLISDAESAVALQSVNTLVSTNGPHGLLSAGEEVHKRLLLAVRRSEKRLAVQIAASLVETQLPSNIFAVLDAASNCKKARLAIRLAELLEKFTSRGNREIGTIIDVDAARGDIPEAPADTSVEKAKAHARSSSSHRNGESNHLRDASQHIGNALTDEMLASFADVARTHKKHSAAVLIARAAGYKEDMALRDHWAAVRAAITTFNSSENSTSLVSLVDMLAARITADSSNLDDELIEEAVTLVPQECAGQLWHSFYYAAERGRVQAPGGLGAIVFASAPPSASVAFFTHVASPHQMAPYSLIAALEALLESGSGSLDNAMWILKKLDAPAELSTILEKDEISFNEHKLASILGSTGQGWASTSRWTQQLKQMLMLALYAHPGPITAIQRSYCFRLLRFCNGEIAEIASAVVLENSSDGASATSRRPPSAKRKGRNLEPGNGSGVLAYPVTLNELDQNGADAVIQLCGTQVARKLLQQCGHTFRLNTIVTFSEFLYAPLRYVAQSGWENPSEDELCACVMLLPSTAAKQALRALKSVQSKAIVELLSLDDMQRTASHVRNATIAALEYFEDAIDNGDGIKALMHSLCSTSEVLYNLIQKGTSSLERSSASISDPMENGDQYNRVATAASMVTDDEEMQDEDLEDFKGMLALVLRAVERSAVAAASEDLKKQDKMVRPIQMFLSIANSDESIPLQVEAVEALANLLYALSSDSHTNAPDVKTVGAACANSMHVAKGSKRAVRAVQCVFQHLKSTRACVEALAKTEIARQSQMADLAGSAVSLFSSSDELHDNIVRVLEEGVKEQIDCEILSRVCTSAPFSVSVSAIATLLYNVREECSSMYSAERVGNVALAAISDSSKVKNAEMEEGIAIEDQNALERLACASVCKHNEVAARASLLIGPGAAIEETARIATRILGGAVANARPRIASGDLKTMRVAATTVMSRCNGVDVRSLRAIRLLVSHATSKQSAKLASHAARLVANGRFFTSEEEDEATTCVGEELLETCASAAISQSSRSPDGWARCISECINAALESALPKLPAAAQALRMCLKRGDHDAHAALMQALNAMGPYLGPHTQELIPVLASNGSRDTLLELCKRVPFRMVVSALATTFNALTSEQHSEGELLLDGLKAAALQASRQEIVAERRAAFSLALKALSRSGIQGGQSADRAGEACTEMSVKLSESEFRPVFIRIVEWSKGSKHRQRPFICLASSLVTRLRSVFVPYFSLVLDSACELLRRQESMDETESDKAGQPSVPADQNERNEANHHHISTPTKRRRLNIRRSEHIAEGKADAARALAKCFAHDSVGFGTDARVKQVAESATSAAIEAPVEVEQLFRSLARAASTPTARQTLQRNALALAKSSATSDERAVGARCLIALVEEMEEEYLPLVPESVPFVAELLEDPSAKVVPLARQLAQLLSKLTGEELASLMETGGEAVAAGDATGRHCADSAVDLPMST